MIRKHKKATLFLSLIFISLGIWAQKIDIQPVISPDFFSPDKEIMITYDVTGTSLSTLDEAWIWLWLPNLNNVDVPSNINPADSDPGGTDPAKFEKYTAEGRTFFGITLILTGFTGEPVSELKEVGLLIKGNDWSDGQSTDYVFDIPSGYSYKINSPQRPYSFYSSGDSILMDILLSESSAISLLLDGEQIYNHPDSNELFLKHGVIDDGKVHQLLFKAKSGGDSLMYFHSYITNPATAEESLPTGKLDGINYNQDETVTLVLTAPFKENVFVVGDFNGWTLNSDYLMKRDGDKFWLEISNLNSGTEYLYQYLIDGELLISDPYSEKVSSTYDDAEIITEDRYKELKPPSEPVVGEATFLELGRREYDWKVSDFQKPAKEDLVIYELLVRDFTGERSYQAVIEKLDYLDSLGINAIELMPVTEFEGNISWGYNTSYMFAADKFYGTEDQLKTLIDSAHRRGIAVIFDIVLNHHFGRSPLVQLYSSGQFGPPTSENVWFNTSPRHDFNVGYDFDHESEYTKSYVARVVRYWTEKYKVDGYRFDLSKGFTQKYTLGNVEAWGRKDESRIAIWKSIADTIWAQDPSTYIILEHFADNNEEKELSDYGMMLWGNMNHTYIQAAETRSVDLSWSYFETRGWSQPNLVTYMESHDEERVLWDISQRSGYTLKQNLDRIKLNAVFFFLTPGPKMIWQFEEFGYDEELNNDRLGIKPTHWEYLDHPERAKLFATFQSLINLKTKTSFLRNSTFNWGVSTSFKWLNYDNPDVKICAFGNFSDDTKSGDPHILSSGTWYNYFTGEAVDIATPNERVLLPGEFMVLTSEPIENYIDLVPIDFVLGTQSTSPRLNVYPNPTHDGLAVVLSHSKLEKLTLKDLMGRILRVSDNKSMEMSGLEPGIYLLEIQTNREVVSKKVIKE